MQQMLQRFGVATAIAILLTLATAWWMGPLNAGALTVVLVVWFGLANGVGALFRRRAALPPQQIKE